MTVRAAKILKFALPALGLACLTGAGVKPAHAQLTFVYYPFNIPDPTPGDSTAPGYQPTIVDNSIQTPVLSLNRTGSNPNVTKFGIGNDGFGNVLQVYPYVYDTGPNDPFVGGAKSDAAALADGSYFSLSITAQPNLFLSISQLQFDVGKGGSSDPRGIDVRSSVDNFSSSLDNEVIGPTGAKAAPTTDTISLSQFAAFQGLTTVTFRIYVYSPNPAGASIDFRNLSISGSATPEPGDIALFALGSLPVGLMIRRRLRGSATAR